MKSKTNRHHRAYQEYEFQYNLEIGWELLAKRIPLLEKNFNKSGNDIEGHDQLISYFSEIINQCRNDIHSIGLGDGNYKLFRVINLFENRIKSKKESPRSALHSLIYSVALQADR